MIKNNNFNLCADAQGRNYLDYPVKPDNDIKGNDYLVKHEHDNKAPQSGRTERSECSADTKLFFDDVYNLDTRGKKQRVDVLQYERSLLSKCAGYTQYFLSDVYTNSTRTKKAQVEATQSGRSMIEMLGVLAIVGVLSVGGIVGYSKAMEMFKNNKMKEQLSSIFYQMIEMKDKLQQSAYSTTQTTHVYLVDIMEAFNSIPDGMEKSNKRLIDVYGNLYAPMCQTYFVNNLGYYDCHMFVTLYSENTDVENSINICKNIITVAGNYKNYLNHIAIRDFSNKNENQQYSVMKFNFNDSSPVKINNFCTSCIKNDRCSLAIMFEAYMIK